MFRHLRLILLAGFALLATLAPIAVSSARPAAVSLTPIVLTPGQDQPITCTFTLTGTLSDPSCPNPTATSTPSTSVFTIVSAPAQGQYGFVECLNGPVSDIGPGTYGGNNGERVICVPYTPTPAATASATATVTATPTP